MSQAVLGGGISGLAAAYYLSKSVGQKIKIFESSSRVGGWIKSVKSKNGTLFELGPRMLRYDLGSSQNTLKLIEEIKLMPETKPVPFTNKDSLTKMLYLNNKLITLPTGLKALLFGERPFIKPLIGSVIKDLRTPKKDVEDESVYDFISRRFGEHVAETQVSSLVCGVFAGDAKEISIKALFKTLHEIEQNHGKVVTGFVQHYMENKKKAKDDVIKLKWILWSFNNGLETLPRKLASYLLHSTRNVDLFLEQKCLRLKFSGGKAILNINGEEQEVDHVYSSLPSKDLAQILGSEHSTLKTQLSSIPFVSVGVVNLEYEGDILKKKAFGCLVPPNQNMPVLGISFDSHVFPQEEKTVLTVMMGGKWFEQHFGPDPDKETLLQIALDNVRKILEIEDKPVNSLVTIAKDCLPQYVVGHSQKVKEIRKYIEGKKLPLTLLGSSYDGVGVNDAILSARTNVERTLKP